LEWQVLTESGAGKSSGDSVIPELAQTPAKAKKEHEFNLEKDAIKKSLSARMGRAPVLAGLSVLDVRGELVLRLPEKLMFDRGEAILSGDGKTALDTISDELKSRPVRIRVEGHTDTTPIHNARFRSNWELSMARAMAVVKHIIDSGAIEPGRMAAAGYGEYHPIASNDDPATRSQNRRVDLIVVAEFEHSDSSSNGAAGEGATPAATGAPADVAGGAEPTAPAPDSEPAPETAPAAEPPPAH
ncbi:MAG TPA: flagellar motor protein MotB, partial [Polyangiaceae bacterium]